MLKLYSYFRSSAAYRARIALHWKEAQFEYIPIHLIKDGGQQNHPEYRKINPMGHVPALDHDGFLVAESMAIVQYLDEVFPDKRLFPAGSKERATVIQICETINSGIQPLMNLKVIQALEKDFGVAKPETDRWVRHWVQSGLSNLERLLERTAGTYCLGGEVTAADCFLVPQCFSARRFQVRIEDYPVIARVESALVTLEPFKKAHPERQPDYSA